VGGYVGNLAGTYFYGENAGRYWGLAGGIIGGVVGYQTAPRVFNALDNITVSTKIAGAAVEGVGNKSVLNAGSKADAIESVDNLPSNIQSKVKNFFKGGSNSYTDFSVEQMGNGNYMAKMTKPGNIPGSKAIYYKEIDPSGNTLRAFKETFDPSGNLVHKRQIGGNMMNTNYLLNFKELQISKKELSDKLGGNLLALKVDKPVTIYAKDVINVLNAFRNNTITIDQLLDWVNTVWFTELFEYEDSECDSIASVLDKLEDLDEDDRELTESDIDDYIIALTNNMEIQ